MWRSMVVYYYQLLSEKSSLVEHVEFITCALYRGVVVVDGGHGWFHTLRCGGCQPPCLRVFSLVTALPAIGLRASRVIVRG